METSTANAVADTGPEPAGTAENTGTDTENTKTCAFLIRREPILDLHRSLSGYRVRTVWLQDKAALENTGAESADSNNSSGTAATSCDAGIAILDAARRLGANPFFGFVPHWVEATPLLLNNAYTHMLPRNRVYLEFPEQLEITPELLSSLKSLAHGGTRFSIRGDIAARAENTELHPFCKVVGYDPALSSKAEIFRQSFQHKQAGRLLLACNTPDKATMDNFQLLGFTLFEGGLPSDTGTPGGMTPRQKTLLHLVTLIMGEGEIPEIQACLQKDPELVKTLLDMVNTPAYGLSQEVESLNQAIMLLGRRQLQRWIQVLMYSESGKPAGYLSPTLIQASARAYFMESLSKHLHPDQGIRAETAFTTGILSVMDQLFNNTMEDLLAQVQVDVPVREALLRSQGLLGPDMRLARLIFPADRDAAEDPLPVLQAMGVQDAADHAVQLNQLAQEAFTWAHSITQAAA